MTDSLEKNLDRPVREFASPVETHLRLDWTVGQALDDLRSRTITSSITYFYVVDADGKLRGVLPTRKLLLSPPETPIAGLLSGQAVTLAQDMTLGDAMEEFAIHRLLALPVVDDQGKLLGVVDIQLYAEEVTDLAQAARQSDLHQLIGLSTRQLRRSSAWASFRARMPWLLGNVIGGLLCATVAAVFQQVLADVVLVAMFIPLVLTLSESVSMQAMTLTLQHLHGPGEPDRRLRMRLAWEWRTVALLALCSAGAGAAASLLWPEGWRVCGVVLVSVFVSMAVSATLGTVIPFSLHIRKLDPRVAAGPVVLVLGDVIATAVYLGLATVMLM